MQGEESARERLDEFLRANAYHDNVVPFPTKTMSKNRQRTKQGRVSVQGRGNTVIVGDHNTIVLPGWPAKQPPDATESERQSSDAGVRQVPDAPTDSSEVARFVLSRFGKLTLNDCTAEERAIAHRELSAPKQPSRH